MPRPNFSARPAATTWMIEMKEVRPAIANEAKKSTPNRAPPGIWEMTVGKVMNDRDTPLMPSRSPTATPCWSAM